jgi:hypothetical protein
MRQREKHEDEGRNGAGCGHTVENDEISNICPNFLRLEDQAGVLSGAVAANCNCYGLGQGQ